MLMRFLSNLRLRREKTSRHSNYSTATSSKIHNTDFGSNTRTQQYLPSEIILLILKSIWSIQDLKSLIRASPLSYRCYVTERRSVLTEVLTREVPPQILMTLFACINAPNVTEPQTSDLTFKDFMDNYPINKQQFTKNHQIELAAQIDQAILLYNIVNSCITDFIGFCFRNSPIPLNAKDPSQQLSPTERHRLLRAFCRYELFVRLFCEYDDLTKIYASASGSSYRWKCFDEIRLLFSCLSPWEAEEIKCVYDYLIYQYDTVIGEINQEVMLSSKSRFSYCPRSNNLKSLTIGPSKHLRSMTLVPQCPVLTHLQYYATKGTRTNWLRLVSNSFEESPLAQRSMKGTASLHSFRGHFSPTYIVTLRDGLIKRTFRSLNPRQLL